MHFVDEFFEVIHIAEYGIDGFVISDVVAEVDHGTRVYRTQPHCLHTQPYKVVETGYNAWLCIFICIFICVFLQIYIYTYIHIYIYTYTYILCFFSYLTDVSSCWTQYIHWKSHSSLNHTYSHNTTSPAIFSQTHNFKYLFQLHM